MRIEIKGTVPSKKNSKIIVCRGKFPMVLPSHNYQDWHEAQMWQLKKFKPPKPIDVRSVVITLYAPDKRKGDLTNKAESLMDLLVDAEIIRDDNWFEVGDLHLKFGGVDKEDPRAIIELI